MGRYLETAIGPLHWVDYGGEGTPIVLVHGLGGSVANWDAIAPGLTDLGWVIALDLPGFGLSPPAADWRMVTMTTALSGFVAEIGAPAIVVGNSMGGLVSLMIASRRPDQVRGLVLVSPAFPPSLPYPDIHWPTALRLVAQATPGLGWLVAWWLWRRHSPRDLVAVTLRFVTDRPGSVPMPVVESLIELVEARAHLPWSTGAVPAASRAIARVWGNRAAFVAMVREVVAPTLVVQGADDRLVSPAAVARISRLRCDWERAFIEHSGHIPQLDAPVRLLGVLRPWLSRQLAG